MMGSAARWEGSFSREFSSLLSRGCLRTSRIDMDALEDYVWPRATSELILLPVTGLECVGDRLLAGEAWLVARLVERGKETAPPRGGATGTKGVP